MDISKDLVAASATPMVLAILAEGESYGYAILKRVSELSGGAMEWTDGMLFWAIGARISDMGWTPNRFAALGMNVVLLVNLGGSAFFYLRFLRGTGASAFSRLWDWQMTYVYVIAGWAAVVAFLFPPLFGFE